MFNKIKQIFEEFKQFATKGDAITLAIGVVLGTAFKGVIDSLVNDIIMPPLGYLTAKVDFSNLYIALGTTRYSSLKQAQEAGAVVITYGNFLNELIIFLITSFVLFIFGYKLIEVVKKRRSQEKAHTERTTKDCKYCYMEINKKATVCPYCTRDLK